MAAGLVVYRRPEGVVQRNSPGAGPGSGSSHPPACSDDAGAAQRAEVAQAGNPATVERHGVVDVASSGGLAATGEGACGAPDAHQVLEFEGGAVPDLESGVIARAGHRGQPEPRQPPREGGVTLSLRAGVLAGRVLAGRVLAGRVLAGRVLAGPVLAGRVLAGRAARPGPGDLLAGAVSRVQPWATGDGRRDQGESGTTGWRGDRRGRRPGPGSRWRPGARTQRGPRWCGSSPAWWPAAG